MTIFLRSPPMIISSGRRLKRSAEITPGTFRNGRHVRAVVDLVEERILGGIDVHRGGEQVAAGDRHRIRLMGVQYQMAIGSPRASRGAGRAGRQTAVSRATRAALQATAWASSTSSGARPDPRAFSARAIRGKAGRKSASRRDRPRGERL